MRVFVCFMEADGPASRKMDLTSLNQAMAAKSHTLYMEQQAPGQPSGSRERGGQLSQLRQEYYDYLAAKKREDEQIQAYNDLASEIKSVLHSVRSGQSETKQKAENS
jgi:hypothetical protein